MPNWCNVSLKITFPTPEAASQIHDKISGDEENHVLKYLKPEPELASDEWYDWRMKNWGCKWDFSARDVQVDGNTLQLWGETAWSPPIAALSDYPEVWMAYCEEGNDYAGIYIDGVDYGFDEDPDIQEEFLEEFPWFRQEEDE